MNNIVSFKKNPNPSENLSLSNLKIELNYQVEVA